MKISKFIEELKWQLETYGDSEVRIDWFSHKQIDDDTIFFNRVIGNHEGLDYMSDEELKKLKPHKSDGLWLRNYPY